MPEVPERSEAVRAALAAGRPVVALESTIISHGLPRPANLAAARAFEEMLTAAGVTPATIAVIDGVPKVGLGQADLERIALDESVIKVSSRDLGLAMAGKRTAGTTVAATSVLAARAGIRVFATGGLGGVHRGFAQALDESADLTVLSRTPITVVSAGVKSILDIPATLERLETLGVAVIGYRTSRFPAFYLTDSGQDLDWRLDSAAEIAAVMAARDLLGDPAALLVANSTRPGTTGHSARRSPPPVPPGSAASRSPRSCSPTCSGPPRARASRSTWTSPAATSPSRPRSPPPGPPAGLLARTTRPETSR
jgi:pseudouridine-5'-phosphate glycosidase